MITFDPTDILFWLFVTSVLFNVVLILALYRLAASFTLVGKLVLLTDEQKCGNVFISKSSKTEVPK